MLDQDQTPLLSALGERAQRHSVGFHTPGHQRGQGSPAQLLAHLGPAMFHHDLPELPGLDNLAAPTGVIAQAQALAAEAFGATHTWFLVNGSTVGVMAAILATCGPDDLILLPRNVHQSAIAGVILAGAIPVLLTPPTHPETGLVFNLTVESVAQALVAYPQAKALLVVSPTYEGICADISALAQLTHAAGLTLIVDEAHGSHFCAHPDLPTPALAAGADIVIQSTHKTLGALTQAAMLHLGVHLGKYGSPRVTAEQISRALRLLHSSSPSYLLLASLDAARHQLAQQGLAIYTERLPHVAHLRTALRAIPHLQVLGPVQLAPYPGQTLDPTRLTLGFTQLGLTGYQADQRLDKLGITAELPTWNYLTFILGLGTTPADFDQLLSGCHDLAGLNLPPLAFPPLPASPPAIAVLALPPRTAYFAPSQPLPLAQAIGHISAEWVCAYPPGIPLLLPGEQISPDTVASLQQLQPLAERGEVSMSGCADLSLQTLQVVAFKTPA